MPQFITFGEIMMRMAPPGFLRLQQTLPGSLDVTFAGAEANVAASLAMFGADVGFVSALPDNALTDACLNTLRSLKIDTSHVQRSAEGRMGIYFVEAGANQRPSRVTYDRAGSTISVTDANSYEWPTILSGAKSLHVTGITPSLSEAAADATIAAVSTARELKVQVSCDLNYRAKLWNWRPGTERKQLAAETMAKILPFVDILIANEADCGDVLKIHAGHSEVESGHVEVAAYPDVARQVVERFPNIRFIATTLRESISASHNNWGAMLFDAADGNAVFAPEVKGDYQPYQIRNIIDRVGGGDAFGAGLLFALNHDDYATPQEALQFATAASCLAHSISGDFNFSNRQEVDALMKGSASGRVVR
ncbi:sugar kinase [Fuerstiella marisgermanici]|uniref:2-dehydro-3-deoxygluconokinase n=1 Tax=Fuerstiella marisgermanici TaxID=1891926 RepID=A0A1P8WJY1_9PLAN|nr:sugar kinase [Fuerstiella marisgermanici]APZ94356.1 2-dehydro-3-deoxygluconokinase [Fuerstiella marisgermanici]